MQKRLARRIATWTFAILITTVSAWGQISAQRLSQIYARLSDDTFLVKKDLIVRAAYNKSHFACGFVVSGALYQEDITTVFQQLMPVENEA